MLIKNINILTRLIINGNVKKTPRTLDLYSHGSNTSVCEYRQYSFRQMDQNGKDFPINI